MGAKSASWIVGICFLLCLVRVKGRIKPAYTMQPLIKKMAISPGGFVKSLRGEFTRLAGIADAIDAAITEARE